MYMSAEEQLAFIKNYLGPAFKARSVKTKIQLYDHNANRPDYPMTILADPAAAGYVDGSAFHLYEGDISALSTVHDSYPDKNIYFTEQYTPSSGSFKGDLSWHIHQLIIGAPRNWSRNVIEWNLAASPQLGPHTPGGCTTCLGALTIDKKVISRNPSYYIIAQAAPFVPPGAVRIKSNQSSELPNVAFLTPSGQKVCIVLNTTDHPQNFALNYSGQTAPVTLPASAVITLVW
jgi:glucosylceramidase